MWVPPQGPALVPHLEGPSGQLHPSGGRGLGCAGSRSVSGSSSHPSGFGDGCDFPIQLQRTRSEVPPAPTPKQVKGSEDPLGSAGSSGNQWLPAPGCCAGKAEP